MLSVEDIQQKIMPICLEYGIKKAEADEKSDVDIRIEKGDNNKLKSLIQVSGFRRRLEEALLKKVDLITIMPKQALYDIFRKKIQQEEVLLYEN